MSAIWQPQHPETTRMWQFMRLAEERSGQTFHNYQQLHDWSIREATTFWPLVAEYFRIRFSKQPDRVRNDAQRLLDTTWFDGATLNFAEQLLQRQDDHPALISRDETDKREVLSFRQLHQEVARCAAGLKRLGVVQGDRVAAVMPNVPKTIIAMLATASIGAIWSSCSPDFGAQAALDRLGQVEPKVLFACDGHRYMGKQHDGYAKIIEMVNAMPSLQAVVVCPIINNEAALATRVPTLAWDDFVQDASELTFTQGPFAQPLYILFSSGTTGKPKCIVHGAGGTLLQHVKELGLHSNLGADDTLCFYTTCGWMMWNWMVSALALGTTLTLYEGAPTYPDAWRLFQLLEEEKVSVFGTSAKFISSVEKAGVTPASRYRLPHLRSILSTGSPLLPKNYDFVYQHIKSDVQLSSISGGTDIVSCFALGNPMLPVYRGELQCPGLGMDVRVFDDAGQAVTETRGELVCVNAFPSMPVCFWQDADKTRYEKAYFKRFDNVWAHGDFAEITAHHGLVIHGRSDAVLNPGGVRIGTAEIYRQIESIPAILDSVVIGQDWQDDVRVVLFVKLREGVTLDDALQDTIRKTIRSNASPRHVPAKILQVGDIPRTISGKIVEIAVRQTVHGEVVSNLQSMANPDSLDWFRDRVELRD